MGEGGGVWHFSIWSDFVSRGGLLRSDYLGRTKCFCWWRVAVISGSWEIDRMHGALAHWSQPQHWQSKVWLVMHKNEVKWATCESVSPSLPCVVNAAQLFVSSALTSLALEWLIISIYKVRGDVLYVCYKHFFILFYYSTIFIYLFICKERMMFAIISFTQLQFSVRFFKWEQNYENKN